MSKELREQIIKKHFEFLPKSDDKWFLRTSLTYYRENGKPNGTFGDAIHSAMEEYASIQTQSLQQEVERLRGLVEELGEDKGWTPEMKAARDEATEDCKHPNSRGYNQMLSYCPDCKKHFED